MIVLSHYPCDLYDDLYAGWHREYKEVRVDSGSERTECLFFNEKALAAAMAAARTAREQLDLFT